MRYLYDKDSQKFQEIMDSDMPKVTAMRQLGMNLSSAVTLLQGYELDNTLFASRYEEYLGKIKTQGD